MNFADETERRLSKRRVYNQYQDKKRSAWISKSSRKTLKQVKIKYSTYKGLLNVPPK